MLPRISFLISRLSKNIHQTAFAWIWVPRFQSGVFDNTGRGLSCLPQRTPKPELPPESPAASARIAMHLFTRQPLIHESTPSVTNIESIALHRSLFRLGLFRLIELF